MGTILQKNRDEDESSCSSIAEPILAVKSDSPKFIERAKESFRGKNGNTYCEGN